MDAQQRPGRVLVADDDALVRELIVDLFVQWGYDVAQCADGAEAVTLYSQCWESIDLVILDMRMPRMSGADAFAAMRTINPDVRVIVASGYSYEDEAKAVVDGGALAFVSKPFDIDVLSRKVAGALARH